MNSTRSLRQRGATLIECGLAAAIALLSVSAIGPGLTKLTERRQLAAGAAQLETDIQYARSLATASNRSLRISFSNTPTLACYVIHAGAAGACNCTQSGTAQCTGGAVAFRAVALPATGAISIHSNSASMLFDPENATVAPTGTVQVQTRGGETLKVIVNIMGRVRSCAATPGLAGYKRC
jgi:type IV fimbrial biogenesis protein FimT